MATITGGANNGRYLYVDYSSSQNQSGNYSNVTATLYLSGNVQGNALSGSFFNVNGTQKTVSGWYDNWGTGKPLNLGTITVNNIAHNSDGTKSISISGKFVYNGSFTYVSISSTVTLPKINRLPGSISSVSTTNVYEVGVAQTISWSSATNATGYWLQHAVWSMSSGSWEAWRDTTTNTTATSYTWTPTQSVLGDLNRGAIKWRVCAKAPGGNSAWKEGPVVEHYGVRVWNGSSWVWGKMRVWNGSAWIKVVPKTWRGSSWVYS